MNRGAGKPTHCLNCGRAVSEAYCPVCGQKNTHYRESVWHLVSEILDDFISLDSRTYRSLKLMLFRPGALTREYNEGRRARPLRPLRMYLFSSIIYFFALSLIGPDLVNLGSHGEVYDTGTEEASDTTGESTFHLSLGFSEAGSESAGADDPTGPPALLPEGFLDDVPGLDDATKKKPERGLPAIAVEAAEGDSLLDMKSVSLDFGDIDTLVDRWAAEVEDTTRPASERELKGYLLDQYTQLRGMTQEEFRPRFAGALQQNLPTMMFFLLPIFALILKVLYPLSKRYYIEHVVFSLHFHSFVFLVTIVLL